MNADEMYKTLAESSLRLRHMQKMHSKHTAKIPQQQDTMLKELEQLRQQIQSAGIGANSEAEDRYLQLLGDIDKLHQSWDLRTPDSVRDAQQNLPGEVQKLLEYGKMLADIYQGGRLVKGAATDLKVWGSRLVELPYDEAKRIGQKLLALS